MELKRITEAEKGIMLELLTNEKIKQTYMLPDFASPEDAAPLFLRLCELSKDKAHFVRGIFADGELVGFLNDVEIDNGTIELGYVIRPKHWGRGYATAALKMAIAQLFMLGYRQVITGAFAENEASIRCMEKAGMVRMDRQDEIEYRGKLHSCVYYGIFAVTLAEPFLAEMGFRKEWLADEATMSYNRDWGGTIDFSEDRWDGWYRRWIGSRDPNYFYRYIYSRRLNTYVGEAAYHWEEETGRFLCDVIVHDKYRGQGCGSMALALLCEAARKNGIRELYDDIALNNPSVRMFRKQGFEEIDRTNSVHVMRKELKQHEGAIETHCGKGPAV